MFLGAVALLGPVSRSSLAERAGEWSWTVQGVVFYALVAACIAFVWVTRRGFGFPPGALGAVAAGGSLAVAVFVALHGASRRAVEGR